MTCPDPERLVAWRTDPDAEPAVQQHMDAGCSACDALVGATDRALGSLADGHPRPPEALQRSTLAALLAAADEPGLMDRLADGVRHFVGALIDGLSTSELAAGLRGDAGIDPRRYRAGPCVLDVALVDGDALLGQLMVDDEADFDLDDLVGARVSAFTGDGVVRATVDDLGSFHCASCARGQLVLSIEAPGVNLVFPDVDVATRPD